MTAACTAGATTVCKVIVIHALIDCFETILWKRIVFYSNFTHSNTEGNTGTFERNTVEITLRLSRVLNSHKKIHSHPEKNVVVKESKLLQKLNAKP